MQTPEQIAEGLSLEMRYALLSCHKFDNRWWVHRPEAIARELHSLGLTRSNGTWFSLNETGLAVREILITKEARRG